MTLLEQLQAAAENARKGLPAALTIDVDGVQYTRNFMPQERLILLGGGTIAAGEPADLTAVDTERAGTVDPDRFLSMGRSTPFAGMAVWGEVMLTLVGGREAYRNGDLKR